MYNIHKHVIIIVIIQSLKSYLYYTLDLTETKIKLEKQIVGFKVHITEQDKQLGIVREQVASRDLEIEKTQKIQFKKDLTSQIEIKKLSDKLEKLQLETVQLAGTIDNSDNTEEEEDEEGDDEGIFIESEKSEILLEKLQKMVNKFIVKFEYSGRVKINQNGENGGFYLNLILGEEQIDLLSGVYDTAMGGQKGVERGEMVANSRSNNSHFLPSFLQIQSPSKVSI